MKQFLLPLLGATLSLSVHAQTIFSSSLDTQEEFDQWTVINANGDISISSDVTITQVTWQFSPTNDSGKRTYYNYHSTNKADDWLISPAITPDKTGTYIVSYEFEAGTTYPESLKMYYGSAPTVEELSKNLVADFPSAKGKYSEYFLVEAEAGVPFYVAYYACSAPDMFRLYAQGIKVTYSSNPVDLAITEVVEPVDGEGLTNAMPVKVKIANKGNVDVAAGSYSVTILVDGTEAFTETVNQAIAKGQEVEVALNGTADLSISHHTYTVTARVNSEDDIFAANNEASATVKHIGPAIEPYTMGFESSEDTDDIKFFDLNEDTGHWSINAGSYFTGTMGRTGVYALCYNYDKDNKADDWAIIDGITMKAGYHVLKYWVSTLDDSHEESFSIYWGNEATVAAMTNKIAEYTLTQAEYKQKICIFKLEEDQVVYIGFHATSAANQNWICIDDIEVNTISATDVDLAALSIDTPTEFLPTRANNSLSFTAMNQGIVDVTGTITVVVDGKKAYESTENMVAQDEHTYTLTNIVDKMSVGKHTIAITIYNSQDKNAENNTVEKTFYKLGSPDLSWDFEDGKVPEEFTVRSEDYATLSSTAISQYGETGVGIEEMYENEYYGTYMLGISTWFTESTATADRWVVLPRVHVDSEDAIFVMNVGSLSEYVNEKYNLCVSDGGDVWYDYNDVLNVKSENYVRKNRGYKLGDKYNDKDVYIAINLKTTNGDALGVDNIELHGCSLSPEESGVNDVTIRNNENFIFDGDILTFGGEEVTLGVYSVNGQLIRSAKGDTFNLSDLAKGVYILRATTSNGVATTKIVK